MRTKFPAKVSRDGPAVLFEMGRFKVHISHRTIAMILAFFNFKS